MSLLDYLGQRNIETHKLAQPFRLTFNVDLPRYWNPILGFDLIKFDGEIIKPPDGVSCREHIQKTHGELALQLIETLISL